MPLMLTGFALTVALGHTALREAPAEEGVKGGSPLRWLVPAGVGIALVIGLIALNRNLLMAGWYTNQGALAETRAVLMPELTEDQRETYFQQASDWYDQALNTDSTYSPASRRAGNLKVARGQYEQAVPLLEEAVQLEPTNPAAIKGLNQSSSD